MHKKKTGKKRIVIKFVKELEAQGSVRQRNARKNSEAAIELERSKRQSEDYYSSLGFDNPIKAADGEPSHDFVYGSASHNTSRY